MAEQKVTTKAELLRLIDQAADEGWTELDLSKFGLTDFPLQATQLQKLQYLDLSHNEISYLPEEISEFKKLKSLDLSSNKFEILPGNVSLLVSLERLIIHSNNIRLVPKSITVFQSWLSQKYHSTRRAYESERLSRENTGEAQGFTIRDELQEIFKYLHVRNIKSSLQRIENLFLFSLLQRNDHTKIESIPVITNDYLNFIQAAKESLSQIHLYPKNGSFKSLEDALIEVLHILSGYSSLRSKVDFLSTSRLFVGESNPTEREQSLREYVTRLPLKEQSLQAINSISFRHVNEASIYRKIKKIKKFTRIHSLDIRNNSLPISPEILGPKDLEKPPGKLTEILNYMQEFESGDVRPLNEAKLLFVGQGNVGKTSLIKQLLYGKFTSNESQTDGLAVHDWGVDINSKNVRLNVWDFGGQEIYHATHQFFLTKRSLYLLVCNCRISEEENRLEYWLKLIQSFGDSSPIIIIGNKKDEQPLDINQRALREKYPNIRAILQTSCSTGDGIDALKEAIETEVSQLKEVYDLLPLKWFEVKEQLEAMDQDFIKYGQYEHICENQGVSEEHNQEQLIRLLHDLGLVLNYRDHPILSNTNVLNPDWVTAGIYALFSDDELKTDTKGILQPPDLSRILDANRYPQSRHSFLIELLKEFQLGFELPNCPTEKRFLLPGLLPKEEPEDIDLDGETLEFQYHYKVLPASVLSRFIVLMHEKIHKQTYWRSGVMLAYKDGDETFNVARIKADIEDKKVFISVDGRESTRRIFLSLIRDTFATIHSAFADREDVTEWVPVPEHPDADPLEYKDLLGLEEMGETNVLIGKLKLRLDLRQLLDGYEPREARQRQQRQDSKGLSQGINVPVNVNVNVQSDNIAGDSVGKDKIDTQNNY